MPFLFQYLLKFSLSLAIFYLFYFVVLQRLTFYQWNRFYLFCYALTSFIIPFINITKWLPVKNMDAGNFINAIPVVEGLRFHTSIHGETTTILNAAMIWNVTGLLFLAGASVMLIRVVYQYLSLRAMKNKAVLLTTGDFKFYDVNGPISPFSFANAIFINSRLHTEEEFRRILEHEFVHVKQKHTIDIVLAEIICIFNWFNPFAWLIRKAIRQNLEFIADNNVLEGGIDPRQYQYLLLKVMGLSQFSITNNFSISSLKKRINMMNKMKSARLHLVKFLFVLPLLVVMLLAFRDKIKQVDQLKTETAINKVGTDDDVIDITRFPGVDSDTIPLKPVPPVAPLKVQVGNEPAAPVPPVPPAPSIQAKKVKTIAPAAPATTPTIPPVPPVAPVDTAPGSVIRIKNINGSGEPLYVVDGKVVQPKGKNLPDISPDSIESIRILKGKDALELYGEKALYGVIQVTTKNGKSADDMMSMSASKITIKNIKDVKSLIIVDGIETSKEKLSEIDPANIQTISVIKGDSATALYKEKGKDGVIIVTTKPAL